MLILLLQLILLDLILLPILLLRAVSAHSCSARRRRRRRRLARPFQHSPGEKLSALEERAGLGRATGLSSFHRRQRG